MIRKCPQCGKQAVKVRMLSFSNRMHCEKCFFQYEYTSLSNWVLAFIGAIIPGLAIILGLASKSWVVFGIVLILMPFLSELLFAMYCALKPVGLRTLRAKLRGKR